MADPFLERYGHLLDEPAASPQAAPKKGGNLATDILSGAAQGVAQGVDETFDTAAELGGGAARFVKGLLPQDWQDNITKTFAPAAQAIRGAGLIDDNGEWDKNLSVTLENSGIETPDTLPGQLAEGITQFATGYAAGGRVLKSVKAATPAGRVAKALAQGAIADFASFDPHESRLSNLIQGTPLANPVTAFLAADPHDDAIGGRIKQTLEGMGLGVLAETFMHSLKGLRFGRAGNREAAEAEAEAAQSAFDTAKNTQRAEDLAHKPADSASPAVAEGDAKAGVPAVVDEAKAGVPEAQAPNAKTTTEVAVREPAAAAEGEARAADGTGPGARPEPDEKAIYVNRETTEATIREMIERKMGTQIGGASGAAEGYNPARDLNWDKIDGPQGVKIAAQSISNVFEDAIEHVRGGDPELSIKEIQAGGAALADEIGTDAKTLYLNLAKTNADAAKLPFLVQGYRSLHVGSLDNFVASVEAAMSNPGNDQIATVVRSLEQVANIQATLKGLTSNTARTLRSLRDSVGVDGDVARRLALIEDPRIVNMLDPSGNSANAADALNKMMGRVSLAAKPGKAGRKAVLQQIEPSLFQKGVRVAESVYVSGLLSNPSTHVVNLLGGLAHNIIAPSERFIAGLNGLDGKMAREGVDQLVATIANAGDAVRLAAKAATTGQSVLGGGLSAAQKDLGRTSGISAADMGLKSGTILGKLLDGLNVYTSGVHRAMLFGDEFNRQMAYRGRVIASALRDGREAGLSGKNLSDYIDKRMADTMNATGGAYSSADVAQLKRQLDIAKASGKDPLMVQRLSNELANAKVSAEGMMAAQASVFQEGFEPGSFSYHMEKTIRAVPIARVLVAPFVRTPTNILKWTIRRTPGINLALKEVRDDLSGKFGDDARRLARARWQMGSMLYLWGFGLATSGMLTGGGPTKPELKRKLQEAGWQPYSVKLGDKYVSINRFDPIAMPLTVIASAVERFKEDDHVEAGEMGGYAMLSFMQALKDKTYLQGVSELMDMLTESDPEMADKRYERFLGQKVGSLVPAIVANNVAHDDIQREARSYQDFVDLRVPGNASNVDPKRNWLGEAMERPDLFPNSLFGIAQVSTSEDPLLDELARVSVASGSASRHPSKKTPEKVDLTTIMSPVSGHTAYDRLMELTGTVRNAHGRTLRQELEILVASPKYQQRLTDGIEGVRGTRMDQVGGVMSDFRTRAFTQLKRETPELRFAIRDANRTKKDAKRKGSDPLSDGDQPGSSYTDLLETFR